MVPGAVLGNPDSRVDFVTLALKGASRGDAKSMGLLGIAYWFGIARKHDATEAARWLYRAAKEGDADAQYYLGCMYHFRHAVSQDPLQAFAWWLKAAEKGHYGAQNNVGRSYCVGEVVQRDYVEAYKWMSLAATGGFEGAQEHCDELTAKMTQEQREESYERVQEFQNYLAEIPAQPPSWWDKTMAERRESNERLLAAMQIAEREPNYERRQIPSEVRIEVWQRDGARCKKCGSRERLHLDHIIPVSKGGSDAAQNLELLCQRCNLAKGARIQ
jgi:hypothetical protein